MQIHGAKSSSNHPESEKELTIIANQLSDLKAAAFLAGAGTSLPVILLGWYFSAWRSTLVTLVVLYIGLFWWQVKSRAPIVERQSMLSLFDRAQFNQYSVGDAEQDRNLIDVFISTYEKDYSAIQSAIGSQDWSTIKLKAHSIKGAALMLGLTEVASRYMELEKLAETEASLIDIGQHLVEANRIWKKTEEVINNEFKVTKPA